MRREFCIVLQTPYADEVFCRFTCIPSKEALRKALCRGEGEAVVRMEIGPVYNQDVRESKSALSMFATERELVFDIDMDDYDAVRTCCSGKKVCADCFQYLAAAARVLERSLKEDFGFEHLLFVFSGRRGLHCWVSDRRARLLTNEGRAAVANYIRLEHSRLSELSASHLRHPSMVASYELLRSIFPKLLTRQSFFSRVDGQISVLNKAVGVENAGPTLVDAWPSSVKLSAARDTRSPDEVWEGVERSVASLPASDKKAELQLALEKVVFHFLYPRLDVEVSKQTNHLLKAPFCIHPASGKVCVPIDMNTLDSFNPDTVPTLAQLVQESREDAHQQIQTPVVDIHGAAIPLAQRSILTPYLKYV